MAGGHRVCVNRSMENKGLQYQYSTSSLLLEDLGFCLCLFVYFIGACLVAGRILSSSLEK